jgi:hypothetical protein
VVSDRERKPWTSGFGGGNQERELALERIFALALRAPIKSFAKCGQCALRFDIVARWFGFS